MATLSYKVYYRKNPKNKIYYVICLELWTPLLMSKAFRTLSDAYNSFRIHVLPELEGKFKEIDQTNPVPAQTKRS